MKRERFLSGMRPTGVFHLKHYLVTRLWVELQKEMDCFLGIYDLLALTTDDPKKIRDQTLDIFREWLICGIDPKQTVIFAQSQIPEHAQMLQLLLELTPLKLLENGVVLRRKKQDKESPTAGIIAYPLQELADVLLFGAPNVSSSLVGNVQIVRKVVRKLRQRHLFDNSILPIPSILVEPILPIPGFDGKRTSSKKGNFISLHDEREQVFHKVMQIPSCRTGYSECAVCRYFDVIGADLCPVAKWCLENEKGCYECKLGLPQKLWDFMADYRERAESFSLSDADVLEVFVECNRRAREYSRESLEKFYKALKFS